MERRRSGGLLVELMIITQSVWREEKNAVMVGCGVVVRSSYVTSPLHIVFPLYQSCTNFQMRPRRRDRPQLL